MTTAALARYHRVLRAVWAAAICAVVGGSLMPSGAAPLEFLGRLHVNDKFLHFSAYALLALLPALHERFRTAALSAAALAGMGVLLEFAQKHVEGRSFEVGDMLANAAGLLCGLAAGFVWRRFSRSQ